MIFVSREKASIFLSYNECMRRMNCGKKRREECSEECADGKQASQTAIVVVVFVYNCFLCVLHVRLQ